MFKISDFSQLARVSVRTLRLYDELDLLKPAQVDPLTGYRQYDANQLSRLNRILALKDLGFSREQIAQFLQKDMPVERLRGMLLMKRVEVVTHDWTDGPSTHGLKFTFHDGHKAATGSLQTLGEANVIQKKMADMM